MRDMTWFELQFFAGEGAAPAGDGAGGANTGVNAADPGQEGTLEALGVPREKAERYRSRRQKAAPTAQSTVKEAAAVQKEEAAQETGNEPEKKRASFEELLADPDYNKAAQKMVNDRLKQFAASEGKAKSTLEALSPALRTIAGKYGMDASDLSKFDFEAFNQKVSQDDSYVESVMNQYGVDGEAARKIAGYEEMLAERQRAQQESLEQKALREHFEKLTSQAEEMKKVFPNFDLGTELKNPVFLRWTSKDFGMSVKDAYYALHREDIQKAEAAALAQKMQEAMANNVMAGQSRPAERGGSQAASVSNMPAARMTPQQRAELKKQIQIADANGERIYPK